MQTFAYVPEIPGPVVNMLALPDGAELAECVPESLVPDLYACPAGTTDGYQYDGKTFTQPGPPPKPPAQTLFAPRDFIALFTSAEQQAIFTAAQSNWEVFMFVSLVTAGTVDVTNPTVAADIDALVTASLLTQARATAVLAGQAPGT